MIGGLPSPIDGAAAAIALVIGAVLAWMLLGGWLTRVAGPAAGGSGWRLLARSAALATGVVPVALGLVSWSWSIGWAAGVGAVIGAAWRVRAGRVPAARSESSQPTTDGWRVALVLGGAIGTLAPLPTVFGVLVGLVATGIARVFAGGARAAPMLVGTTVGAIACALVAVPLGLDAGQLGAVLVLALVGTATVVLAGRGTPTR